MTLRELEQPLRTAPNKVYRVFEGGAIVDEFTSKDCAKLEEHYNCFVECVRAEIRASEPSPIDGSTSNYPCVIIYISK